jgi:hypothetical protein
LQAPQSEQAATDLTVCSSIDLVCLRARGALPAIWGKSLNRTLNFQSSHHSLSVIAFPIAFRYPPVTPILKQNQGEQNVTSLFQLLLAIVLRL